MPNQLMDATSPYLRQHADNPVDWRQWGEEAFEEARRRDVPVLLSVGYSSCHWCHVMAHESFEDEATAEAMNAGFVSIKVDREERPDVDAIYMEAVQALTARGGWPMTVFLTPDGRPFYAGTYFPRAEGRGLPSFGRVLQAISEAWRERRDSILEQAAAVTQAVETRSHLPRTDASAGERGAPVPGAAPRPSPLARGYQALRAMHDDALGGFGPAPKFPQPSMLEAVLWYHARSGDPEALEIATITLDAMASGGMYDHLGGGFHRYSTDARWLVPHFEKMLYDQAGLVRAYLHGWQLTGRPTWLQVIDETVAYVLRDLHSQEGGLCSAEDADSEGEEGKFY
ncbi:MAG: thioredoxin domain-containing protein, partial [Acidimicrobiales bacterium]|nr:thioredoxin domain-containing protein [Acidimicrobiales bacterium]